MARQKSMCIVFALLVICLYVRPVSAEYCYYKNDSTNYNFYDLNDADHYALEGASYDTGIMKAKGSNGYWDGTYTVFEEVGLTFQPSESGKVKVAAIWQADYHIWTGGNWPWHGLASITVKYVLYRGTTFLESRTVFSRTADHSIAGQESISGTDSRDTSTYFQFSTILSSSLSYTVAVRLEFSMLYTSYIEGVTSGTAASVDVDCVYAWNGDENP